MTSTLIVEVIWYHSKFARNLSKITAKLFGGFRIF